MCIRDRSSGLSRETAGLGLGATLHSATVHVQCPLMRILLVSTYEMGHQPLHLASPAATLLAAGHEVRTADVAIEPLDDASVAWADAVAFSVPMHTAMRLAVRMAEDIRQAHPYLAICLYGLYA